MCGYVLPKDGISMLDLDVYKDETRKLIQWTHKIGLTNFFPCILRHLADILCTTLHEQSAT